MLYVMKVEMACKTDVGCVEWGDTQGQVGSICQLYKLNRSKSGYLKHPRSFLRNGQVYPDCHLSLSKLKPNASNEERNSSQVMMEHKLAEDFNFDKNERD